MPLVNSDPFIGNAYFSRDEVQLAEAAVFLPAYLGSSAGTELQIPAALSLH